MLLIHLPRSFDHSSFGWSSGLICSSHHHHRVIYYIIPQKSCSDFVPISTRAFRIASYLFGTVQPWETLAVLQNQKCPSTETNSSGRPLPNPRKRKLLKKKSGERCVSLFYGVSIERSQSHSSQQVAYSLFFSSSMSFALEWSLPYSSPMSHWFPLDAWRQPISWYQAWNLFEIGIHSSRNAWCEIVWLHNLQPC